MTENPALTIPFGPELALDLWYQALGQEIGLIFEIEPASAESMKIQLYLARRDIGDPRLDELTLHLNNDRRHFLIYKKTSDALP